MISNDYYWEISPDEIYDPYKEPENFTLGQLSDDMQEYAGFIILKI